MFHASPIHALGVAGLRVAINLLQEAGSAAAEVLGKLEASLSSVALPGFSAGCTNFKVRILVYYYVLINSRTAVIKLNVSEASLERIWKR